MPYGHKQSKETREKIRQSHLGKKSHFWKGKGGYKTDDGYIKIMERNHPFCDNDGYVREHRLIMEKFLGRYLKPEEVVHHINGNKADNRIENLKLFANMSEHFKSNHLNRFPNECSGCPILKKLFEDIKN